MAAQPTSPPTGAVTTLEDPPLELAPADLRFRDRADAGRQLATLLARFRDARPVIIGMPRGGVPVAAEVARSLGAPLDVAVVRKVGAPQNPEFAIGAVAEGGVRLRNSSLVRRARVSEGDARALTERAEQELDERAARYRGARKPVELSGRTAILVDDGLATGSSAQAAIRSLRGRGAARVILAVPVAAPKSVQALRADADEIVCVLAPEDLWAVGLWYEDFSPTTDEEVVALLSAATATPLVAVEHDARSTRPLVAEHARPLTIDLGEGLSLEGELTLPQHARGIVVFAHGSGSSRLSPRNQAVARALRGAGFGSLLFDLLTPREERDRAKVFDIALLASRLRIATESLTGEDGLVDVPLAYFGASTGAAAALTAAARLGDRVRAVVSRGGRADLALNLRAVRAATLLIVGGEDREVLVLNRHAQHQLRCVNELAIVPGATHLFEEQGALERVSRLAIDWLEAHLATERANDTRRVA